MNRETQHRYLSVLNQGESLTQKEVAARLGVTVSAASRNLRTLYEKGLLKTKASPGMSLRYSRTKDFEVIRKTDGSPLYLLYSENFKGEVNPYTHYDNFVQSIVSKFIDGDIIPAEIREVAIPTISRLSKLFEILANASPGQIQATRQALVECQGSNNES